VLDAGGQAVGVTVLDQDVRRRMGEEALEFLGLRLMGRSRQSAEKIMRVRGRSKRRLSENIT
jgi:hypothetical protein